MIPSFNFCPELSSEKFTILTKEGSSSSQAQTGTGTADTARTSQFVLWSSSRITAVQVIRVRVRIALGSYAKYKHTQCLISQGKKYTQSFSYQNKGVLESLQITSSQHKRPQLQIAIYMNRSQLLEGRVVVFNIYGIMPMFCAINICNTYIIQKRPIYSSFIWTRK